MNSDEILKQLCESLKPELDKLLQEAALEACSFCDEEVPFEIIGLIRDGIVTDRRTGKTLDLKGWRLYKGPMIDEPLGVARDYTGWARLRMTYMSPDPEKLDHVQATRAADGTTEAVHCEDRRLLICPSCLPGTGMLSAAYYKRREGRMAERIDPDPDAKLCAHKAENGKCLEPECSFNKKWIGRVEGRGRCLDQHYPGVVCGSCSWQGKEEEEDEPGVKLDVEDEDVAGHEAVSGS